MHVHGPCGAHISEVCFFLDVMESLGQSIEAVDGTGVIFVQNALEKFMVVEGRLKLFIVKKKNFILHVRTINCDPCFMRVLKSEFVQELFSSICDRRLVILV